MTSKTFDFEKLEARRRKLEMSCAALARRSGVSLATVQRILSGKHAEASFANVLAIAQALDMSVEIEPNASATEVRQRQARQKAERLVNMVQATSGLEAQPVSADAICEMTAQTASELLAGSPRELWSEW
jgi:transcriptional regulator with XRE-family HTH domain